MPAFPAAALMDSLASLVSGNCNTKLLLPVAIIEAGQTLSMLRNPFNLLKPNYRKQVGKLTPAHLLSKGSSIWLEQLFGWRQFKSDVDEAAKLTAKFLNSPETQKFCDLSEKMSANQTDVLVTDGVEYTVGSSLSTWNYGLMNNTWDNRAGGYFRRSNVFTTVRHRLGCLQSMNASNRITKTRMLFQQAGSAVNAYSIRDILWEVTPFSFVIDWFVDTRGLWYLPNYVRLSAMDVKCLCYSSKYESTYNIDWQPSPMILNYLSTTPWYYRVPVAVEPRWIRSSSVGKSSRYVRKAGFPVLDSVATNVFANKGLTWNKLVTGGALFAQRFFH
jgi:hypothetical protein